MFKEHNEKLVKKNKAIFLQGLLENKESDKAYSLSLKEGRAREKRRKEPPLALESNGFHTWVDGRLVFINYSDVTDEMEEAFIEQGAQQRSTRYQEI